MPTNKREIIESTCADVITWMIDTQKTVHDNLLVAAVVYEILRIRKVQTTVVLGKVAYEYDSPSTETVDGDEQIVVLTHRTEVDNKVWLTYKEGKSVWVIDLVFDYGEFVAAPVVLGKSRHIVNLFSRAEGEPVSVGTIQNSGTRAKIVSLADKPVGSIASPHRPAERQKVKLKSDRFKHIMTKRRRFELVRNGVGSTVSRRRYPVFGYLFD